MGSLFLGSVHKTSDTGTILDSTGDRNLISYSGTESSWAYTGERYGEYISVFQLVWSDEKYDVLFGANLSDVVGTNLLFDNDVAAEFTKNSD